MPTWSRFAVAVSFTLLTLAQVQLWFPLNKPIYKIGGQPFAALLLLLVFARWEQTRVAGQKTEEGSESNPSLNVAA